MTTDLRATVAEAAERARPSLEVVGSTETGSFDDAAVELRDGHVRWRIIRERSVLGLAACPEFDRSAWYDADLLKRFLGQGSGGQKHVTRGSAQAPRELMTKSVQGVISDLEQLRQPISAAFAEVTWETTRRELMDLGRRRDAELFGRPYPK
jgi:hypothetical protein